jgi:phage virion morphogenesis protein
MAATLELRLRGDRAFDAALGGLLAGFDNLEPLMERFGVYLESSTIERFDTETAPDGSAWDQSIRAKEEGGQTLTDSSQLRSSIHAEPANGSVRWGSNKVYARIHNEGFDKTVTVAGHSRTITQAFGRALPGGLVVQVASFERAMKMPKRPFLGINAEDEAELVTITEKYAAEIGGLA